MTTRSARIWHGLTAVVAIFALALQLVLVIKGGRVLDYSQKPNRQMCRLFLSMMDKMNVHEKQFGDATEPLDEV